MDTLTSPLLDPAHRHETAPDPAATDAELTALIDLAVARRVGTVAIGSGRTPSAVAAAAALTRRWTATGGNVSATVTWPETAASWLRQARRFCHPEPDLWIMTGPPTGWAQMTRRLLWSTNWDPARTLATVEIGTPGSLELVGRGHLEGLTGATADGATWTVSGRQLWRRTLPVGER
ncbi:hypothetical protein [Rhodococcus sp. NPDC059234]|uniref:hypothetical protein n=1 Tax=Rhodococcus sp. NPDC059234 TaxID=3346781 RepID=UPI00366CB0D4